MTGWDEGYTFGPLGGIAALPDADNADVGNKMRPWRKATCILNDIGSRNEFWKSGVFLFRKSGAVFDIYLSWLNLT